MSRIMQTIVTYLGWFTLDLSRGSDARQKLEIEIIAGRMASGVRR